MLYEYEMKNQSFVSFHSALGKLKKKQKKKSLSGDAALLNSALVGLSVKL